MRDDEPVLSRDSGFTLIEMTIAIALLGVVMLALTAVLFGATTADRQSEARLDAGAAEQFASTYFAGDVQGARADDDAHPASDGVVAGGTARCGTSAPVVEFLSDAYDASAVSTARIVVTTYVLTTGSSGGRPYTDLHRLVCEATNTGALGAAPLPAPPAAFPLVPTSDLVVARRLSATVPPSVSVSGGTVTLTLTPLEGAAFAVTGQRRTS